MVITGGGAQLKHLKQLAEYITGMDTRIGYPNEHLAGNSDSETTSPLYATAVGLVLNSLEQKKYQFQEQVKFKEPQKSSEIEPRIEEYEEEDEEGRKETKEKPFRKSIFDKWAEKFKDFLDNAE